MYATYADAQRDAFDTAKSSRMFQFLYSIPGIDPAHYGFGTLAEIPSGANVMGRINPYSRDYPAPPKPEKKSAK